MPGLQPEGLPNFLESSIVHIHAANIKLDSLLEFMLSGLSVPMSPNVYGVLYLFQGQSPSLLSVSLSPLPDKLYFIALTSCHSIVLIFPGHESLSQGWQQ